MWYLSIFSKQAEKIKISLKSEKNSENFTCKPTYNFIISRSVLLRMRNVSNKCCRESPNKYFVYKNVSVLIVPFMKQCVNKLYSRADYRWQLLYTACTLLAGYLRLQTHTVVLLFHCNSGWNNAPCNNAIQILTVLFPLWTQFQCSDQKF
jgi:hypothetical protein